MTKYTVSDGDYLDGYPYSQLIDDIQRESGYDIGRYPEIVVSLDAAGKIEISGSNDDMDAWEWTSTFGVPAGWDQKQIETMFPGYVYYEPQ